MLSNAGQIILMLSIIGIPLSAAVVIAVVKSLTLRLRTGGIAAVLTSSLTATLVGVYWYAANGILDWRLGWFGAFDIGAGLYVDGLSVLFAVLVAGVSLLSLIYSLGYIPHEVETHHISTSQPIYYAYMLFFTGSMLGMVFSGDLIQLYVFWELTGIASFLLIGLNWRDQDAREGSLKALLITALGGIALLTGFIILGLIAGTFSLSGVIAAREIVLASPLSSFALILILIGAATKSAQFPFHIWLPAAMVAPTPVSAFLHSAALVAMGVYLLARMHALFCCIELWQVSVVTVGLSTAIIGGLFALGARRFKELLAYSTISQYGIVFALLGYPGVTALNGALFVFFQHGIIKAGLFFVSGMITYATGKRKLDTTAGLWRRLPIVFTIAVVLALSLGGLPVFSGFWNKEIFLESTLHRHNTALAVFAIAAALLTLIYMLRFLFGVFVDGEEHGEQTEPLPKSVLITPGILAALSIFFGFLPGLVDDWFARPAAQDITGETGHLPLVLHFDERIMPSLLVLSAGTGLFILYRHRLRIAQWLKNASVAIERAYSVSSRSMHALGSVLLKLQNGSLQRYVHLILVALVALIGYSMLEYFSVVPFTFKDGADTGIDMPEDYALALLLLLVMIGSVATFVLKTHLQMILALSVVGYVIAGIFALEFAPDVALVQVHVETLVTVLFVLALIRIPKKVRTPLNLSVRERLNIWLILTAGAVGVGTAWLSWVAITYSVTDPIADWYNQYTFELTHARDVVAAIITEFRGLDTLGEISVFAAATLGVYAIVRIVKKERS